MILMARYWVPNQRRNTRCACQASVLFRAVKSLMHPASSFRVPPCSTHLAPTRTTTGRSSPNLRFLCRTGLFVLHRFQLFCTHWILLVTSFWDQIFLLCWLKNQPFFFLMNWQRIECFAVLSAEQLKWVWEHDKQTTWFWKWSAKLFDEQNTPKWQVLRNDLVLALFGQPVGFQVGAFCHGFLWNSELSSDMWSNIVQHIFDKASHKTVVVLFLVPWFDCGLTGEYLPHRRQLQTETTEHLSTGIFHSLRRLKHFCPNSFTSSSLPFPISW